MLYYYKTIHTRYQLRSNKTILKLGKPRINALKRRFAYHGPWPSFGIIYKKKSFFKSIDLYSFAEMG